ncbi:MAG: hypothetical protein AB1664_08035 [Thermodesulfobacteriota bacterium]
MNPKKKLTFDDVSKAFDTNEVFNASDELLMEYLSVLNTEGIENDRVRHRAINRCITIHAIISLRLAKIIDRSNKVLTWIVIVLASVSVVGTIVQIYLQLFR